MFACNSGNLSSVEKEFLNPPDSILTSVYWYWISDNISKEAVVKDLHAMKKAGINRAFIGNIGLSESEAPYGKVKIFSDEWWEITHTAMKTATELNIELGLFNSPGWSQSGGPWIQPENSMRYLASSELRVTGPQKLSQNLIKPTADFQDVKVIAWKVDSDYGKNLLNSAKVTYSHKEIAVQQPTKSPEKYSLPNGNSYINFLLPAEVTARSLVIYPTYISTSCELQVKKGDNFETIKTFDLDRTNAALNVGFDPYAPIAISFPETTGSEFRLSFRRTRRGSSISNIVLSPTPFMERYPEKTLAKMFQSPLPYWHDYMWKDQPDMAKTALEYKDISGNLSTDGTLNWDVPEGEWIIMRTGMSTTGVTNSPATKEGTGLEVDKMSKEHVAHHFNSFVGKILERIPAEDRKSWKVVVADSYETGGQNFTDNFIAQFKERYGYDLVPYLPVFNGHVVGSYDLSDRFLWDIRRFVADKISYDYVGGLREISNKHGLTTWLENYGHWGFPGEFLQYGGQSDEIGGEFWSEGNLGDIENRAASSSAHIYGKVRVSAESFTSSGSSYARHPATLKKRGDWSFTEGINNTLLHVYIQQPYEDKPPGVNTWFGTEFNRLNTWFSHMDLFSTYLKRNNFMLQLGLNVADVAYFIGEDAPKMTGVRNPELPKGHSYDYINAEVIIDRLEVKDGKLVLPHGTSYQLLVLPDLKTMRPELLQKIEKLVADGAVIMGPPPSRSPSMENYPEADKQVKELAEKMWGDISVKQRTYGKGMILTDMTMEEAFELLDIQPDCVFGKDDPALYTHRTYKGSEIYFVTNQSDKQIKINPQFRVSGMQPEQWDAVNGSVRSLPAYKQNGKITEVPLQLEAYESAFIVFRKKGSPKSDKIEDNYPENKLVAQLNNPWQVTFESDKFKRGPQQPVVFEKLQDWTEHADDRIKYYSGKADYKTSVKIESKPKNEKIFIDLGKLSVMAKVKVNGKYAGGAWTAPYRVDITKFVNKGDNEIEIEVVNTWVNRLIGDQKLPAEERPTWAHTNSWNANSPLQSSGLVGPVVISSVKYK